MTVNELDYRFRPRAVTSYQAAAPVTQPAAKTLTRKGAAKKKWWADKRAAEKAAIEALESPIETAEKNRAFLAFFNGLFGL